ncbi:MAG: ABC-2 family transporter protein [Symbiobacteriaceae bacterium]|nr:ABC-2 family transporter protein [Symbiobacteriaceae bacterium]
MSLGRKYSGIFKLSLLNSLQYPASSAYRFIFYTIFISTFFCLWQAIYQNGEVSGYSLQQMIWYLCLTELIVFCCSSAIYDKMNSDVKSGAIAYLLCRPCHYLFFQFAFSLGEMAMNLLCFGSFAILLATLYVGFLTSFSWLFLPLIICSMLLGMTINFFLLLTIGLTAFIWEENTGFYFVYQKLIFMLGMFFPVEFLPDWLQKIAKSLPFSYVAWAPARLAVAFNWEEFQFIIVNQFIWAVFAITLANSFYHIAVRHLQGQGG